MAEEHDNAGRYDGSELPEGPWGVWLHPARTFRHVSVMLERIGLLEDDRDVRRRELSMLVERISEMQKNLDASRAEATELRSSLNERGNALAAAEASVRKLTAELEEMQRVADELEEFRKQLDRFEDVKRNYERRIRILRGRIREMDDKALINDELAIDMDKSRPDEALRRPAPVPVPVPPENDWLRLLDPDL